MATGGKMTIVMVLIKDFPYYRNSSNLTMFKIMLLARVSGIFFKEDFQCLLYLRRLHSPKQGRILF